MKRFSLTLFSLFLVASALVAGEVDVAGLSFQSPDGWTAVLPTSSARAAQWTIPGGGEVVLFFFGAGQGGDDKVSVARWSTTMTTPQGIPATGQTTSRKGGTDRAIAVTEFDIYGSYSGSDMPAPGLPVVSIPNYGLSGVVLDYPGGPLFLRVTGPEALVRRQLHLLARFVDSAKKVVPPSVGAVKSAVATLTPKA